MMEEGPVDELGIGWNRTYNLPRRYATASKARESSGKVYRYFDFPRHQYDELLAAESKGTYFAEQIRGKFRYEEVGEVRLGRSLVYSSGK